MAEKVAEVVAELNCGVVNHQSLFQRSIVYLDSIGNLDLTRSSFLQVMSAVSDQHHLGAPSKFMTFRAMEIVSSRFCLLNISTARCIHNSSQRRTIPEENY